MAELASGAVHSLLFVIRNEGQLLSGVGNDVQFIKEEMESMNSFLQHLARTTPPGGEHDEQVRTWMKQVRDLAYECSSCIDTYLQRGDPAAVRLARVRLGYLWGVIPWYLKKLYAQHRAAIQLRKLKDRARDVGKRRQRYGVETPTSMKTTTTSPPSIHEATSPSQAQAADGGGEGIFPDDDELTPEDEAMRAQALSEPHLLEECTRQLVRWLRYAHERAPCLEDRFQAIAIAAPDEEDGADIANEALAHPLVAEKFKHFWITSEYKSSYGNKTDWLIEPLDILRYIQKDLFGKHEQKKQQQKLEYEIDTKIEEIMEKIKDYLGAGKRSCTFVSLEPLDILHDILAEQLPKDPVDATYTSVKMIIKTAEKLKAHLERGKEKFLIGLDHSEYEGILRELLPHPKEDRPVKEATDKSDDDQITKNIKEIMTKMKGDVLWELKPHEDKSMKEATDDKLREDQTAENIKEATQKIVVSVLREMLPKPREDNSEKEGMDKLDEKINETTRNIGRTLQKMKDHLLIKEALEMIKGHLKDKTTLIVLDGHDDVDKWGKIKKVLNMLGCADDSTVIVITRNHPEMARKFCNPPLSPMFYSLVGFYHNKVRSITSQLWKEEQGYMLAICRDILKKCEPHEFCMKIFARALYVNPNMSKQELDKLHDTLVFRWEPGWDTNARKMLKFSYSFLPREHQTCLWYLAIFPRGHKIRRSSLVGRWVADGLVKKEDWLSSVRHAERCFDELINRCFVYPGDIGAAGKVKSCIVHDIVHERITNIAKKEHFVETRLSHHHSRHFSVLSEVRIRRSDTISKFLVELHESHQLPLVKVLDLEGCDEQHFRMKQHYLKNVCNKMLLLKYLSLRNILIIELPREINNLHQLEVLDIRQTGVKASTTKHLMLLKLKRLLANTTNPTSTSTDSINRTMESFNAVELPRGIEKMTNMEVLTHVEASEDLKDIGKLWQLRKLGVVIHDKADHLKKLVTAISDLSESLQSLSISIKPLQGSSVGIPPSKGIGSINPRNILESLTIRGKTSGWLLLLLVKHCHQLVKATLYNTSLNQDNLKELGELPKLRCVRLQHESYTDSNLTFTKEEFLKLKYLVFEGSNMTDINFEAGAAPELEKIDLSAPEMNNISFGNGAAPKLEKIILSNTKIATIKFEEGAAPKLEEIVLSETNITKITFENKEGFNLRKIVLSFYKMEFLSEINNLPGLQEVELKGGGIKSASLVSLFTKAVRIAKVILSATLLKQEDLQILGKQPSLRCLMLLEKSCAKKQLTFNEDEFPKLKLLIVQCSNITNISFTRGAAPNIKKIVWSFTEMESLSGIDELPKLKELEFNGYVVPFQVRKDINAHPNDRLVFKHNKPQNEDKGKEQDDEGMSPFFGEK